MICKENKIMINIGFMWIPKQLKFCNVH